MTTLSITHRTHYRFQAPVQLGPHRMMLRPREGRDLRLEKFSLTTTPEARIDWAQDVAGNAVATANFQEPSAELLIESRAQVELCAARWPVFPIAASAARYPFRYSDEDWTDLGSLTVPGFSDPEGKLLAWAYGFVLGESTDTLSLLQDLSAGVASAVRYEGREAEGTFGPLETLARGAGSCRDMAVLFVDAARALGIGARIVSGYLHDPDRTLSGTTDAGSTHAWAELFVPGAGWISFDPTNRGMGSANLIPVARVRDIRQAVPVAGSFAGGPGTSAELEVGIRIEPVG